MINVTVVGRIGKNAAVIETKNGKNMLTMDVATDLRSKGENQTMWVRICSTNEKLMREKFVATLVKGKPITITGTLGRPSAWVSNKTGEPMAQDVVWANSIDYINIGTRKDGNQQEAIHAEEAARIPDPNNTSTPFPEPAPEGTEDLPF